MREIKFRAWDKVNKVMLQTRESWLKTWKDSECDPDNDLEFKKLALYVSQDGHVLEDTFEHGVCDLHYYLQGEPKYDLMQYTGLKDRNGKEIYEGDIIRYEDEDGDVWLSQIIWDTGDENIFISGFRGQGIRDITEEIYSEDGNPPVGWTGEWEVIGNIYENLELISNQ